MSDPTYADVAALFTEAAQRVRECTCPGDIAEALPAIVRAYHAIRPYFDETDCPILFSTIPLRTKELRGVEVIEIADPDGSSRLPFYILADERNGNLVPLLEKRERDKLAVLLDRWARFFEWKGALRIVSLRPDGQGESQTGTLQKSCAMDDEDEIVLRTLASKPRKRFTIKALWMSCNQRVSEKVIGKRLLRFVDLGWAERGPGKKSGVAITDEGKRIAASLPQATAK